MRVQTFPRCCGAGVLVLETLTGKGKEADLELIKEWVYYARRNGYRMYDFPQEYGGQQGNYSSAISVIGGKGDQKAWSTHSSWGMLLAMTAPHQKEAAGLLKEFGFKELFETQNPVYGSSGHKITLWGLDLNKYTKEMLEPKSAKPVKAKS